MSMAGMEGSHQLRIACGNPNDLLVKIRHLLKLNESIQQAPSVALYIV